uniref:50S ribosomal protein L25 n=1 Tax=Lygus hesperus TaxID=30085 RepID=A0A0A9VVS1_LYGHE
MHADERLVWRQIHTRWPQYVLRIVEHVRSHHHVQLLPPLSHRTPNAKVPLVEEVPHLPPNGPVCRYNGPRLPATFHRLQLSQSLRLVDRNACRHVLLPLQRVLQPVLQRRQEKSSSQVGAQWKNCRMGTAHTNGKAHTNGTTHMNGKSNGFSKQSDYYVNATQTDVNGVVQRRPANGSVSA